MVVTFTLISCLRGYLVYKDIWNLIVSETLNCEVKLDPYAIDL